MGRLQGRLSAEIVGTAGVFFALSVIYFVAFYPGGDGTPGTGDFQIYYTAAKVLISGDSPYNADNILHARVALGLGKDNLVFLYPPTLLVFWLSFRSFHSIARLLLGSAGVAQRYI